MYCTFKTCYTFFRASRFTDQYVYFAVKQEIAILNVCPYKEWLIKRNFPLMTVWLNNRDKHVTSQMTHLFRYYYSGIDEASSRNALTYKLVRHHYRDAQSQSASTQYTYRSARISIEIAGLSGNGYQPVIGYIGLYT